MEMGSLGTRRAFYGAGYGVCWSAQQCLRPRKMGMRSRIRSLAGVGLRIMRERESFREQSGLRRGRKGRVLEPWCSGAGYWTSPANPWSTSVTNVVNHRVPRSSLIS